MIVERLILQTPSFFNSPKIRVYPQAFSRASRSTSVRMSSGVFGRPGLARLLPLRDVVSPLSQRVKVRGETMVIRSRMVLPSGLPYLSRRCRSDAVTLIRLGSLSRRMRFSALRY
jgi:hypothetical protein